MSRSLLPLPSTLDARPRSPDRRALLTGSAALAAMVPATAFAAVVPDPDPIFAAIEAHRRAFNAFEAVLTAKGKAEIEFKNETGFMTPTVVCTRAYFVDENNPGKFKLPEDITATSHTQIDHILPGKVDPEHCKATHADLDKAIARYAELVTPHEAAEDAVGDIERDAAWDYGATVPTTFAGLAAMLRYERELQERGYEILGDRDEWNNFLLSIETAVCALAGLPARAAHDEQLAVAIASRSIVESDVDAELVALGREFDAALIDWSALVRESASHQAAIEAAVYRETGITHKTALQMFEASGAKYYDDAEGELGTYFKSRNRICAESHGTDAEEEAHDQKWDAVRDRADPVVNAIFSLPATTIAGIGVKARAAMYVNSEWWIDRDERYANGRRELVAITEDICTIAGVPMVDGFGLTPPSIGRRDGRRQSISAVGGITSA